MAPLKLLFMVALTGTLLLSGLGFLGGTHWFLDLFSHFRLQYAVIGLLLVPAAILFEETKKTWIFFALLVFAVNSIGLTPFLFGSPPTAEGEVEPIHLLVWNTARKSTEWPEIEAYIRKTACDVVVLQEASYRVIEKRTALQDIYYIHTHEEYVAFVVPRLKPVFWDPEDVETDESGPRPPEGTYELRLSLGDGHARMLFTQMQMPVSSERAKHRSAQIRQLAAWSKRQEVPHLIAGDMSMTPWSAGFKELIDRTELRDSMIGFGLQSTWPFQNDFVSVLRIPIDHCLVGPGFVVTDRRAGPSGSSNHRPLLIRLHPGKSPVR